MRIIKFRAWDLDNLNMWYSDQQGENDGCVGFIFGIDDIHFEELQLIDRCVNGEHEQTEEYRTPKQVIMQFTGLLDKSGKEVYEGDRVTFVMENQDQWTGANIGIIYYELSELAFMIRLDSGRGVTINHGYDAYPGTIEVVGNIYENPAILK